MQAILNYRKLADGMQNNQGKEITNIYRSAVLSHATESDIDELVKAGIKQVYDLRNDDEIERQAMLDTPKIDAVNIKIIDQARQNDLGQISASEVGKLMIGLYHEVFTESEGFKTELQSIIDLDGDGFLFHCTAGKDRTGITGAILMYLLGFSEEQIYEEYLTIDQRLVEHITKRIHEDLKASGHEVDEETINGFACVQKQFLDAFIDGVKNKYGSIDNYIANKLEITEEQIKQLKQHYLV